MSYFFENRHSIADRMRHEFQFGTSKAVALSIMEPARAGLRGREMSVFMWRAAAALNITAAVLVWLRDEKQQPITYERIYRFLDLGVLRALAVDHVVPAGSGFAAHPVPDFPTEIEHEIVRYIHELPRADIADPRTIGAGSAAADIHEMCVMELTRTLMVLRFPAEAA